MSKKQLLKGNIALAKAAIKSGCTCYFGYPITPQSEIGEYLSRVMQENKLGFVCAESEIGAINMALGASSVGAKVMVSSSSCAVSLMQEALSYACSDELPIVLVNVMRAGPGQGYIYPSQGDYNQTTTGGGNGDYKIISLSPMTVQECIEMTYKAFYYSQKYRNPVILLLDGLLGQMAEGVELFDYPYPETDNSSWRLEGAKNRPARQIRSLEPSQDKLNNHILKLNQKYKKIEEEICDWEEYYCEDAEYILTAFGSLARHAKAACKHFRQNGLKFGLIRPKTLYPFPYKRLNELSKQAKKIIDIEMNLGQMLKDVRLAVGLNSSISFIGKPVGNWLKKEEIILAIENVIEEKYAGIY
jgi:2-oxoglutarate ferredoxin oxidoreductase subunit alpha